MSGATSMYSRVTVVNGTRQVDLALPTAVPLSDVMPQLLRFCAPEESPHEPATWTLGRLGGANLSLAGSVADADVADGEVLELRTASSAVHPAYVEDVRDTVEDAIDQSGRQWRPRTTVGFALAVAACGLAAALLLPEARQPGDPASLALAGFVAMLSLAGAWWAGRQGHHRAVWALVGTAALWGGAAGWLATAFAGWSVALASAALAALATTALARTVTVGATAHLAAMAVVCASCLPAGIFVLSGLDIWHAVRIVAVLAILAIGVLPRISLTVGGIAGADYRVRHVGLVSGEQLARRIRHSDILLHGSLVAIAVVGLVTGLILTSSELWWDSMLGLATGLALLARSRVFSRIPHILAPRLAGLIVLIGQGLTYQRGVWPIVAAAIVFVAVCAIPLSDVARARLKQVLNLAETVTVTAMIPLAAGGLGLFTWMASII
ncbi:MAG TPA: type VII secretion integral membrane protein EccD [Candidatus Limnocylindrales bacterium]